MGPMQHSSENAPQRQKIEELSVYEGGGTEKEGEAALPRLQGLLDISFPIAGAGIIRIAAHYERLKARSTSPPTPNITWCQNGAPSLLGRGDSPSFGATPARINAIDWVELTANL